MQIEFSHTEEWVFRKIAEGASHTGVEAYVIGGFVRDKLMGRLSKDIDIVCVGSGLELAKATAMQFSPKPKVVYYKNFGTAQLKWKDLEIEFVGARRESYRRESRKPIVENGSREEDQQRRDFTINTLAISLQSNDFGLLIDPFNGQTDIENGVIKTPLDPHTTFSDDPLRMMRAIRFASQLGFHIEEKTLAAIRETKERIVIISQERIAEELNKIILSSRPSVGIKLLFDTGLLHLIFPEMVALHGVKVLENYGHKDNFYHTLQVLDNVAGMSDDLWLRWAAILHDIAKPVTQRFEEGHGWTFHGHEAVGARWVPKIFGQMKLPLNEKMKFVQKLVELHLRPISLTKENITDSAIRRLIFDAGDDLEALLMLCEADITSKNADKVKRYKRNLKLVRERIAIVEQRDHIRNWQPPVTGEQIMEIFGIKPSRQVGDLKNALKEAILEGEVANEYETALSFLLKKGGEMGLKLNAS